MESHLALLRHIAEERAADAIMELDRVINLVADIQRYAAGTPTRFVLSDL